MKKRVLVVDDDHDILYSVKAVLEDMDSGFNVTGVDSGEKCLDLLRTERPDLILMDIIMPEMDGWDVIARIKENQKLRGIPIIVFSARVDFLSKAMGRLVSEDYVEKPFEALDLKNRIDAVLDKGELDT